MHFFLEIVCVPGVDEGELGAELGARLLGKPLKALSSLARIDEGQISYEKKGGTIS